MKIEKRKGGRPNRLGIDWSKDQKAADHAYYLLQPRKTHRRWWTGLSEKEMGHTAWTTAYRKMMKEGKRPY